MDKSNERLFKEVFPFVAIGVRFKNDSVLFYIIEFCGNESTNGGKEDFEVILIVIWWENTLLLSVAKQTME